MPNTFTGGTPISASEVNQNFAALAAVMPAANMVYNYNNGDLDNGLGGGAGSVFHVVGLTFTPPADGVVIVTGGVLVTITQSAPGGDSVAIGIDRAEGGGSTGARFALNTTGGHAQTLGGSPIDSWIFHVTGGTATTFTLYLRKMSGTNQASYNQPWISALFVPGSLPCTAAVSAMSNYGCY